MSADDGRKSAGPERAVSDKRRPRPPRPLDSQRRGTTKSLNAVLLEALRADLLGGQIAPGVRLKIPEISAHYQVTAAAAREALSRLVPEGLVDFADQRGFRSAPVTAATVRDVTRVRILVEREALRDAIRHGDEYWEGEIMAAEHRLRRIDRGPVRPDSWESSEWTHRHKEFHTALVSACQSPWLLRLHDTFYDLTERFRFISANLSAGREPRRDVEGEHALIAKTAIARDEAAALELIERHILNTAERVLASGTITD